MLGLLKDYDIRTLSEKLKQNAADEKYLVSDLILEQDGKTLQFVDLVMEGGGAPSAVANIFWLVISGIPLAITAALNGLILCCTVIGIPFGLQCFKMAKLALMPFGATVT